MAKLFLKKIFFDYVAEFDAVKGKKLYLFRMIVENAKLYSKSNVSSLPNWTMVPFIKAFQKRAKD